MVIGATLVKCSLMGWGNVAMAVVMLGNGSVMFGITMAFSAVDVGLAEFDLPMDCYGNVN